jgi:hypothetical protein
MSAEAGTAEAARRTRPPITMGLGAVILIVALVFAFSSIYGHWYALFRDVHVVTVVFWVGGGLMITVLALLADRRHDAAELATLARQAAFVGEKLVAPAGLVVLLSWGRDDAQHRLGLGPVLGRGRPGRFRLDVRDRGCDPRAARQEDPCPGGVTRPDRAPTQAAIRRVLLIARVDVAVLVLVVADMVTKLFT